MSRILPILFNTDMVQAILDERKTVTRRAIKNLDISENNGMITLYEKDDDDAFSVSPIEDAKKEMLLYSSYQPGDILYIRETWAFQCCIDCMDANEDDSCMTGKISTIHEDKDAISEGCYIFRADHPHPERIVWNPSIHMPRAAARIWLRVTDVRVEQLQEITEEQATREGITRLYGDLSDAEYIDWTKRTGIYPKAKAEWGYKNYLWHGNFGAHGAGNKLSDTWEYQYSSYDSAIGSFSSLWNLTVPLKDWNVYGWNANPWVWAIEFERCRKPESEG